MQIIIHTEVEYLPAFREMAKAVKARVEEVPDEVLDKSTTVDDLIAMGLIEPAKSSQKNLSDLLNQFDGFPLNYEDAKALRHDAWKRNG